MVLIELLKKKGLIPQFKKNGIFIATIGNVFKKANRLAESWRKKGVNVYINTAKISISKQLSIANSLGYKKVIILGERDVKEKKITVKNMITGKEKRMIITKFTLKKKLEKA
jgi:histidyl-tRNA synthetase